MRYAGQYTTALAGVQKADMIYRTGDNETINGIGYSKIVAVITGLPGSEPTTTFTRMTDSAIYSIDGAFRARGEYAIAPLPLEIGRTWTVQAPQGPFTMTAEAVETVETANKTYKDCLKLVYSGRNANGEYSGRVYLAPGIGQVRTIYSQNGVTLEWVLQSK